MTIARFAVEAENLTEVIDCQRSILPSLAQTIHETSSRGRGKPRVALCERAPSDRKAYLTVRRGSECLGKRRCAVPLCRAGASAAEGS